MISTVLSSPSVSWLTKEIVIALIAASGGVVVLIGLWWEEYSEKEEYRDIDDFRSSKKKELRGRKWVFWGVAFEILLTFGTVISDGWEIRQVENSEPLKQPVASASVFVKFSVDGRPSATNPYPNAPKRVAPDAQARAIVDFGSHADLKSAPIGFRLSISADKLSRNEWDSSSGTNATSGYTYELSSPVQTFGKEYNPGLLFGQKLGSVEDEIKRLEGCRMTILFLPPGTHIRDGGLVLVLNSTQSEYDFPEQTIDGSGAITGWRTDPDIQQRVNKLLEKMTAPGTSAEQKGKMLQQILEMEALKYPGYFSNDFLNALTNGRVEPAN